MNIKFIMQRIYLEYINNFLTLEAFASHYDISELQAQRIIDLGRCFHKELTE